MPKKKSRVHRDNAFKTKLFQNKLLHFFLKYVISLSKLYCIICIYDFCTFVDEKNCCAAVDIVDIEDQGKNMLFYNATLKFRLPQKLVVRAFWARILCRLAAEDACFRMRITLGVVLIRSLVFHFCVSECSRNGSGVRPYLWVQEKFV